MRRAGEQKINSLPEHLEMETFLLKLLTMNDYF